MNTAQIVVENVRADLDRVLFTTPEAQRRYLERLEARLFGDPRTRSLPTSNASRSLTTWSPRPSGTSIRPPTWNGSGNETWPADGG